MKIYTHQGFEGFWPIGTAAIVRAKNPQEALDKLNAHLKEIGLPGDANLDGLEEFSPKGPDVVILQDGNY